MRRSLVLVILFLVATATSGCTRTGFDGSIRNDTDEAHDVTVRITRLGQSAPESEKTYHVHANETDHDLGTLFHAAGTYHIGVLIGNGTGVQETIEWSKKTGPDVLTVWLRPDRVDLEIAIV